MTTWSSPTLQIQRARGEDLFQRNAALAQALLVDVLRDSLEHGARSLHAIRHGIAGERALDVVAKSPHREERSEVGVAGAGSGILRRHEGGEQVEGNPGMAPDQRAPHD